MRCDRLTCYEHFPLKENTFTVRCAPSLLRLASQRLHHDLRHVLALTSVASLAPAGSEPGGLHNEFQGAHRGSATAARSAWHLAPQISCVQRENRFKRTACGFASWPRACFLAGLLPCCVGRLLARLLAAYLSFRLHLCVACRSRCLPAPGSASSLAIEHSALKLAASTAMTNAAVAHARVAQRIEAPGSQTKQPATHKRTRCRSYLRDQQQLTWLAAWLLVHVRVVRVRVLLCARACACTRACACARACGAREEQSSGAMRAA